MKPCDQEEVQRDMKAVSSPEELKAFLVKYGTWIFVREEVNGKWGNYTLSELPHDLVEKHVNRLASRDKVLVLYTGSE